MEEEKPTPQDSFKQQLPCECGNKDHKAGLIIGKWGDLSGLIEDKIKIQIFKGEEIKSVVIDKNKLTFLLEELK